jgi:uncharacterized protein YqeY
MMSIKEQLQTQLKDAMRAGDDLKKSTLRMAISAIRLAEIDKGSELDDNAILAILQKEVKSRQESIEEAQQANRPELAQAAQQEIEVLKAFLPEQLSSEELEAMAKQVIEEIGATSMREMGAVMKALVPRLEGRATGQQANQVVRKLLA